MAILLITYHGTIPKQVCGYSDKLNDNNHKYPVYPVLTLWLNNQTVEGLQAQIMVFNQTSHQMELNQQLLKKIQQDLNSLPALISGLKQLTLYDYNTSFLPGCVYLLLSPDNLSEIGTVANKTISHVLSNHSVWWYVENLTYNTLDLERFAPLEWLCIDILDIYSTTNYSVINDKLIINYPSRDDITASLFVYNGTYWSLNLPFLECYNNTLAFLNNQYIFSSLGIKLFFSSNFREYLDNKDQYLNGNNITTTISNTTDHLTIWRTVAATTSFYITISYPNRSYPHNLPYDEELQMFLIIYVLFSHIWFTEHLWMEWVSGYDNNASFTSSFFTISSLIFLVLWVECLKRIRKRKHNNC